MKGFLVTTSAMNMYWESGLIFRRLGMGLFLVLILIIFKNGNLSKGFVQNHLNRPNVVNIGSILSLDSLVGKVAQIAIMAAVEDINSNPDVIKGTKINITTFDSNSSGFLGFLQAVRFMETETMAIIGPQSSVIAHVISHIANELQVPLLSFAATDPTLSSLQYPFFVRTSINDLFQMAAIAEIVDFYEWRAVIAVYIDDDFGRNGIAALSDQLAAMHCSISYNAPLSSDATRMDIQNVLVDASQTESRIIVVHTYPSKGLDVFSVAKYLGMLDSGFVWIATSWLSTIFDSQGPFSSGSYDNVQGVITLRIYTPDSPRKRDFTSRWMNLTKKDGLIGLNAYALYAYDTVWLLARSIDAFFTRNGNVSFSRYLNLSKMGNGSFLLDTMNSFNEGKLLLDSILHVNMTGVTGSYSFTSDRNLIHPAFEVINVIGSGMRGIGYWSNYSGLSIKPPDFFYNRPPNRSSSSQELFPVIWPGQLVHKPRGWVFPNNGRQLKIGVPNRVSFREFVTQVPGTDDMFRGYCIDIFYAAIYLLPYGVPYKLIPYGDGKSNISCTELVRLITTGVYDAAIGDIAITTNRTRMVDFTQPYIESGLVVVVPVKKQSSNNDWAFLRPFTPKMWGVTGLFFLFIGVVIWILEHRTNDDFRGPPKKQLVTILWFSFSTLFFAHRENIVSTLGRVVLVVWLFVVLIINSSYTANLTSMLTVQQLSSPIKGIESLQKSDDPIGYQQGSFARDYLVEELGIHESRLIPLNHPEDYAKALTDGPEKGGVAAIVDERAYVELFLSTHCEFSIVGRKFTRNGWGFAFPKDSPLAVDMSTAILKLSENGELQRIHDKWLLRKACSSQKTEIQVDRLDLGSFSGLFIIFGLACVITLAIYFVILILKFNKHYSDSEGSELSARSTSRLSAFWRFLSFVDKKEESVRAQ